MDGLWMAQSRLDIYEIFGDFGIIPLEIRDDFPNIGSVPEGTLLVVVRDADYDQAHSIAALIELPEGCRVKVIVRARTP